MNGHDPDAYLKDSLKQLPMQPNGRIQELLPHRWQASASARTPYLSSSRVRGTFRPSHLPRSIQNVTLHELRTDTDVRMPNGYPLRHKYASQRRERRVAFKT